MLVRVNPKDGLPVYLQIMQQVKHHVVSGDLKPGDRLPPAKKLAMRLLVNANTVVRAYNELEREGVVVSRRGSGTYIAEGTRVGTKKQRLELLQPLLERTAVEGRQLGLLLADIIDELSACWNALGKE